MILNKKMSIHKISIKKTEQAVKLLLESFGYNINDKYVSDTSKRVAKFYKTALSGNLVDPNKFISCFTVTNTSDIIIIKNIFFYSLCEHHLLPFFGNVSIAYIPKNGNILGFSKFSELINIFSMRLQLQEKLTKQIANIIVKLINPHGVIVVVCAKHLCMSMCFVNKIDPSEIITSCMRGVFLKNFEIRSEAMNLLKK
jgi:GTP cyclohydrolase I